MATITTTDQVTLTTSDQTTITTFEPTTEFATTTAQLSTYIPTGSLPALPPEWTPEPSCFEPTMWRPVTYVDADGNTTSSDMFAIPTITGMVGTTAEPSGSCVPPSYSAATPYITDSSSACPASYTEACRVTGLQYAGNPADLISCCPSVAGWDFTCYNGTAASADYGCTTLGKGTTWTGTAYEYDGTTATESRHVTTTLPSGSGVGRVMNAYAVVMVSTAAVPTTSSGGGGGNGTTGDSTTGTGDDGLSTGAVAGIGVGVAAGVILFALLVGYLFWRRRRRQRERERQLQQAQEDEEKKEKTAQQQLHLVTAELPGSALPHELNGPHGEGEVDNPMVRPELHGQVIPAELQGEGGGYYRGGPGGDTLYWVTPVVAGSSRPMSPAGTGRGSMQVAREPTPPPGELP